jgi:hypothetical protein
LSLFPFSLFFFFLLLESFSFLKSPHHRCVASIVFDQQVRRFFQFTMPPTYYPQLIWSRGYGSSNYFKKDSPPPDADSVVRIASNTKIFTGLMMFQLRDRGAPLNFPPKLSKE